MSAGKPPASSKNTIVLSFLVPWNEETMSLSDGRLPNTKNSEPCSPSNFHANVSVIRPGKETPLPKAAPLLTFRYAKITFSICDNVGAETMHNVSDGSDTATCQVIKSATTADLPQPFADLTAIRGDRKKS